MHTILPNDSYTANVLHKIWKMKDIFVLIQIQHLRDTICPRFFNRRIIGEKDFSFSQLVQMAKINIGKIFISVFL